MDQHYLCWWNLGFLLLLHWPDLSQGLVQESQGLLLTSMALRLDPSGNEGSSKPFHHRGHICPDRCTCKFHMTFGDVECINANFDTVPTDIASITTSIMLIGNNFTSLKNYTFLNYKSLEVLTLSRNGLQELAPATFFGLSKLGLLDLSNNKIAGIQLIGVFEQLYRLSALNLSNNELSSIHEASFIGLSKLTALHLSNCAIEHISLNSFHPLENLELLDVSNNNLRNVSNEWFLTLKNLRTLLLYNNKIIYLKNNVFQGLQSLEILDLSGNYLDYLESNCFSGLTNLKQLSLQENNISVIYKGLLDPLINLKFLNLSANLFSCFNYSMFKNNSKLVNIQLTNLPFFSAIFHNDFKGLESLQILTISNNPSLQFIQRRAFRALGTLENLDISHNALNMLPRDTFSSLVNLQKIALDGNPWHCDCSLLWLPQWFNRSLNVKVVRLHESKCVNSEGVERYNILSDPIWNSLNCTNATITYSSMDGHFRLGASALLECQAAGNPVPSIIWILPRNYMIHWYPEDIEINKMISLTPSIGNRSYSAMMAKHRIKVLRNGNLYISQVMSVDAGTYLCHASNVLGNDTAYVPLTLDYEILVRVKLISILVGLATSVAVLLLLLIFQLIRMAINRWGCCCCDGVPPKAKQIRKILENVEQYKTQQLDRLRDNYNMQVHRIKDNCTQQMERLRDSYASQVERLRDICDFGTHQLDRLRDQYYDQVKRVRDYSGQQMNRVRENYIFQRNRIRKFSAHQLLRLRENYKLQQLHVNKILENLNIENCRTGCGRADSIVFDSELIMNNMLLNDLTTNLDPLRLTMDNTSGIDHDQNSQSSDYFTPTSNRSRSSTPSSEPPQDANSNDSDSSGNTCTFYNIQPVQEINKHSNRSSSGSSSSIDNSPTKKANHEKTEYVSSMGPTSLSRETIESISDNEVSTKDFPEQAPIVVINQILDGTKIPNDGIYEDSEMEEVMTLVIDPSNKESNNDVTIETLV